MKPEPGKVFGTGPKRDANRSPKSGDVDSGASVPSTEDVKEQPHIAYSSDDRIFFSLDFDLL